VRISQENFTAYLPGYQPLHTGSPVIRDHKFFINSFPVLSGLTVVILLGFIGGGVCVTKLCDEITMAHK